MQEFTKRSKYESVILYETMRTFGNFSSSKFKCIYFVRVIKSR